MLFDFVKKRAQEGVEQTQNLVTAAQTGRLDEALKETSAYVKDRRVGLVSSASMQQAAFLGFRVCCSLLGVDESVWALLYWLRTQRPHQQKCNMHTIGDLQGEPSSSLYT